MNRWLLSTNAKEIGTLYLIFAVFAGMIGTAFSVIIRLELASPGVQILQGDHQLFNVVITAHAILMSAPFNFNLLRKTGLSSSVSQDSTNSKCRTQTITCQLANNYWYGIADGQWIVRTCLPSVAYDLRVSTKAVNYKDDYTLCQDQMEPHILSRIYRYVFGNIRDNLNHLKTVSKAVGDIISAYCFLLTKWHSNEETQIVQTTKGTAHDTPSVKNEQIKGTGDLTASGGSNNEPKRRRNCHSNSNKVKDNSLQPLLGANKISNKASNEDILRRVVGKQLDEYINDNKQYNGIIRIIANPEFLIECYKLIKRKPGNMSKGTKPETLDGINYNWFEKTAEDMLTGRFNFSPARQVMIPKANSSKLRPLQVGQPREKIVQKAIQVLLSAIYEPKFLPVSHGFRPHKSTHSALDTLHLKGGIYVWVVQGDISKCFDSIPHKVILESLQKDIKCARTLNLVERALKVGYINEKNIHIKGTIGTPQGSVMSPILSNIVLHSLDLFVENSLKPEYTKGSRRRANPLYTHYSNLRRTARINSVDPQRRKDALMQLRKLPRYDMRDPNFKRLLYVRYADDFVILTISSREEALAIRERVRVFLQETCGLELNMEKTVVTSLRKGFFFLGARCVKRTNQSIFNKSKNQLTRSITRRSTLRLAVDAPIKVLVEKLILNGFARRNRLGTVLAKGLTHLIHLEHADIIKFFNSRINGILNYYSFAGNRSLLHRIFWILRQSCALTLARKFKLRTMRKAFKSFGFDLVDKNTEMKLNIPSSLQRLSDFKNSLPHPLPHPKGEGGGGGEDDSVLDELLSKKWSNKLTKGTLGACCLCGSTHEVEMHHLRKVSDIRQKIRTGNVTFSQWQGAVLRKQIPLCQYHHQLYHKGLLSHSDLSLIAKYSKNL